MVEGIDAALTLASRGASLSLQIRITRTHSDETKEM